MDYLRQQIEASLGRSEELIMTDKARRQFYRYPSEPPPLPLPPPAPKKSSKERGTFNSVRLKKYLGLGSKRKQKIDKDEVHQTLQQKAYLEELQRYGPIAALPPYYECHPAMPIFHPSSCYKEPWAGGGGTVRIHSTPAAHPSMVCASVSARSGRQRTSLQSAMYAWEPFFQGPKHLIPMSETVRHKENLNITNGSCNCEEQFFKSMRHHCTKCTCSSGSKSQKAPKCKSRTSLFNSDVICYSNSSSDSDRRSKGHERTQPSDHLTRSETNVSKSKLRHLSDVGSRAAADLQQPSSRHDYRDAFKRKSILECPVNPYELMMSGPKSSKRLSAPARLVNDSDHFDDSFSDIVDLESPISDEQPSGNRKSSTSDALDDKDNRPGNGVSRRNGGDNDKMADISLGGQRIRLFGSVKGTVSTPQKSAKRPPLLKESNMAAGTPSPLPTTPPRQVTSRPPQRPAPTPQRPAPTPQRPAPSPQRPAPPPPPPPPPPPRKSSTLSPAEFHNGTFLNRAAKQAKEEEGVEEMFRVTASAVAVSPKALCEIRSVDQNRTRITVKCGPPPTPPPPPPLPPQPKQLVDPKGDTSEDFQGSLKKGQQRHDVQEVACQTVIAVGLDPQTLSNNRLNLKINLSELSAYLKPILKKSAINESSSASSEAEGSETYFSNTADGRRTKKKHVHFLPNRLSSNNDDVSQESNESEPCLESLQVGPTEQNHFTLGRTSPQLGHHDRKTEDTTLQPVPGTNNQSSESLDVLYDDALSTDQNSSTNYQNIQGAVSDWAAPDFPIRPTLNSDSDSDGNARVASLENPGKMHHIDPPGDHVVLPPARRRNRSAASRESRKANLRRSQSDRAVVIVEDQDLDEFKACRLTPIRSNSFQALVPPSLRPSREYSPDDDKKLLTFCSPNNLNSTPHGTKKSMHKAINQQQQQQGVYQNDFKANNNNSAVTAVLNSIATAHHQQKLCGGGGDTRTPNSHTNVINHSKNSNNEGDDDDAVNARNHLNISSDSSDSSTFTDVKMQDIDSSWDSCETLTAPVDIAKLRAIPKFLPRPIFTGKHKAHVCHRHKNETQSLPEVTVDRSPHPESSTGWSSSEDDLYTDGSSVFNHQHAAHSDFNKPLPPIPTEDLKDSSSSSPEYSSNENIYERIPEHVYEEVPELVPYQTSIPAGGTLGQPRKSIFEGASRIEILNYLEDAKERGVENIEPGANEDSGLLLLAEEDEDESQEEPDPSQNLGTKRHHRNRISNVSNLSDSSNTSEDSFQNEDGKDDKDRPSHQSAEVERNDSGVGSETSKPSRLRRQSRLGSNEQICVDCDQPLDIIWDHDEYNSGNMLNPLVCQKCSKKRSERKEIILEFVETEIKYGRDLKIIKEEFHRPMLVAGLLTEDLLNNIFLNLDQLVEVNEKFSEKLRDALDIAAELGDEDYNTVNVGKVFLESSIMLHAFEVYCVRQGTASLLLTNLEKDRELLRIFLKVSQMENTLLRRLNLNSFLMVPVQRVTKYPLLLNRLYKVTPHQHQDREAIREAQLKIELHLEHINQQAKDFGGMNIWRRISNISNSQRRNLLEPVIGNIKLRKTALEILQWNNEDVRFVMEGRLQYTQLTDHLLNKREKSLKLTPVHGLLITLGNPNSNYRPDLADRDFIFPRNTGIREATLVLIKEKSNRFHSIREPLHLQRCVISSEPDVEDIFEIQEFTMKESYLLKGDDAKDTQEWLKMLRYHAKDLGAWRRRRNALANIMINGMAARREWL